MAPLHLFSVLVSASSCIALSGCLGTDDSDGGETSSLSGADEGSTEDRPDAGNPTDDDEVVEAPAPSSGPAEADDESPGSPVDVDAPAEQDAATEADDTDDGDDPDPDDPEPVVDEEQLDSPAPDSDGAGGAGAGGAPPLEDVAAGGTGGMAEPVGAGASAGANDADPWQATEVALDPVPPPESSWSLPTGDPLNATPAAIAALGDAIVVGGAAPAELMTEEFVAEAFVARLDQDGAPLWQKTLPESGFPHGIVVDADDNTIVMTPHFLTASRLSTFSYGDEFILTKFDSEGELVLERVRDLGEGGDITHGLAVAPDGSVYVTGSGGNSHPVLAKYDGTFNEQWVTVFEHDGTQGWANAVVVLPNGDVALTGYFDATLDFGGGPITSLGVSGEFSIPNGFVARLTSDGDHVYSRRFGGTTIDGGTELAVLGDDLIVVGGLTGEADVGGRTVTAAEDGSAFVASLNASGDANWVSLVPGVIARGVAVHEPSGNIYVVGQLGGDRIVANYDSGGQLLEEVLAVGTATDSYDVALDQDLGLWISGSFSGDVDFGNDNILSSDIPGAFLVRLAQATGE
jgi:hypothetical protein